MSANLPMHLTMEHAARLEAVLEDARQRSVMQLLDQGYDPKVVDRELAFVYARLAARFGLNVGNVAAEKVDQLELINHALHAELRSTLAALDDARRQATLPGLAAMPEGRTVIEVSRKAQPAKRVRAGRRIG